MKSVISTEELHKVSSFADTIVEQMTKVDTILDTMSAISTPEVDRFSESVNKLSDHFSAVSGDLKNKKASDTINKIQPPKKLQMQTLLLHLTATVTHLGQIQVVI